jgi:hypothetical protein
MIQFLIAVDQTLNTLTWAKFEGFGFADETLSARMWRLQNAPNWNKARKLVDFVFEHLFYDFNHCERSFYDEYFKHQLPEDYRSIIGEIPDWYKSFRPNANYEQLHNTA